MKHPGIVTMDGETIGNFVVDKSEQIVIMFNKDGASVEETLEFAAENGMTVALSIQPDFNGGNDA